MNLQSKDPDDEVDSAKYLAEKLQVDAQRISIAYRRSSPIYYANGLKGNC